MAGMDEDKVVKEADQEEGEAEKDEQEEEESVCCVPWARISGQVKRWLVGWVVG